MISLMEIINLLFAHVHYCFIVWKNGFLAAVSLVSCIRCKHAHNVTMPLFESILITTLQTDGCNVPRCPARALVQYTALSFLKGQEWDGLGEGRGSWLQMTSV